MTVREAKEEWNEEGTHAEMKPIICEHVAEETQKIDASGGVLVKRGKREGVIGRLSLYILHQGYPLAFCL